MAAALVAVVVDVAVAVGEEERRLVVPLGVEHSTASVCVAVNRNIDNEEPHNHEVGRASHG